MTLNYGKPTPLEHLTKMLAEKDDRWMLWHSGGGIMLARLETRNGYVLVSESEETDGTWAVGFYHDDADEHAVFMDSVPTVVLYGMVPYVDRRF